MKKILFGAMTLVAGLSPALAEAAEGYATANVNMRSGPSTAYPAVTVIPVGAPIEIHGCLADVPWCDVSFAYGRGWVAGRYVQTVYQQNRVYLEPRYYRPLGIPTVTFEVGNYWDRYYRNRDFYRDRDHWRRGPDRRPDRFDRDRDRNREQFGRDRDRDRDRVNADRNRFDPDRNRDRNREQTRDREREFEQRMREREPARDRDRVDRNREQARDRGRDREPQAHERRRDREQARDRDENRERGGDQNRRRRCAPGEDNCP